MLARSAMECPHTICFMDGRNIPILDQFFEGFVWQVVRCFMDRQGDDSAGSFVGRQSDTMRQRYSNKRLLLVKIVYAG